MESKQAHADTRPRPASELPGLVNQDTTLINPDAGGPIEFHESGVAENEVSKMACYLIQFYFLHVAFLIFSPNTKF